MIRLVFVTIGLVFLNGCGSGQPPAPTVAPPATVSAPPVDAKPAVVEQPSLDSIPEVPDFTENREVYKQDPLEVIEATVVTFDKPGASLKEVNWDVDKDDDFDPKVEVLFQEGSFGKGQKAPNAILKQRGASTRAGSQKSYKITLNDKSKPWRNHTVLNLNKHPYDLTRMRNKLSFDLFKDFQHMGSLRTQFVHITHKEKVDGKGKDLGLFTLVEHSNQSYFDGHALDPKGNLYFVKMFDFRRSPENLRLSTDPKYSREKFEEVLEFAENDDHSEIIAMLDDLNNDALDIDVVMKKHFNLNNYLTWLATNILLADLDTNSQNFTLYSPGNSPGWYFIPWDYDGAWDFVSQPNQLDVEYLHLRWSEGISNWMSVKLHRRFFSKPGNLAALLKRIEELRTNELSEEKIKKLLASYLPLVKPLITNQPDLEYLPVENPDGSRVKDKKPVIAGWEKEYNRLPSVIDKSYKKFLDTLDRPMPFYLGSIEAVKKNVDFYWDKSFTLDGEKVTYDFLVSKTPLFEKKDLLLEILNVDDSKLVSDSPDVAKFTMPRDDIPLGTLYLKIVARSAKNPDENWQTAFDKFGEGGKIYDGVMKFVRP